MAEIRHLITMRGERVPYEVIRAEDGRIVRTVIDVQRVGNVCACHANPNAKCRQIRGKS